MSRDDGIDHRRELVLVCNGNLGEVVLRVDRPLGSGGECLVERLPRDVRLHDLRERACVLGQEVSAIQRRRGPGLPVEPRSNKISRPPLVTGRDKLGSRSQTQLGGQFLNPRDRQLGHLPAQALDELRRRLDRDEVGLGEVAVVVRLLLRAVDRQAVGVGVVVVRRLDDLLPTLVRGDLLPERSLDRPPDVPERVHVLDLPPRAESLLAGPPHRHVDVGAQRALLHVGVRDPELADRLPQQAEVRHRLVGRAEVGGAHDLEQRGAAAVEVDEAVVGAHRAARRTAGVDRLSRVLLEVGAHDPDLAPVRQLEPAGAAERSLILADLIALRQVGVEVILAREDGALGDLAVEGEPEQDRHLDRAPVRDGQRAGMGEADRAGVRVLGRAVRELAAAEHLGARLEMGVHLETDDRLPLSRRH